MKSVMNHSFAEVSSIKVPRSSFNRSCGLKTTFDAGYLVPIFVDEVIPGDTFNLRMSHFARLSTMLAPPMDNIYLSSFFFFVPTRLIWDNFKKFHGEEVNPGDTNDYQVPTMNAPVGGHANGSLSDYLGFPTKHHASNVLTHISLVHRAYNLIYNEHFRDQNLIDSAVVDKDDGPDTSTDYVLRRRGKRHDYFTSCTPWPQKADDGAVSLPLGTSAPVVGNGSAIQFYDGVANSTYLERSSVTNNPITATNASFTVGADLFLHPTVSSNMVANLSSATAATIDDLITSFQVQALYRRDAKAGTRYPEIVLSHYGVKPYDLLYRPLYLGGGVSNVNIHPVANTSADGTKVQGELSAFGTSSGNEHGFIQSFAEHGYIIGLICVDADLTYQEGLDRMYSRQDRFDFYYPGLANLSEQAVLNKEIFANGSANDELVFGYQERWAEYRHKQSRICGQFRSNDATSLDVWHLSEEFGSLPALNQTFIESNPPIDRIVANASAPHIILDAYFNLICARPMPTYSIPSLKAYF